MLYSHHFSSFNFVSLFSWIYPSSEKEKEDYLRWHHQIVCVYTTKLTSVDPPNNVQLFYSTLLWLLQRCLGGSGVWTSSEASKTTKPRSWHHNLFYSYDSSSGPLLQELGWAIRFGYRGAGIWNKLPEDSRERKSMNLFKSKMYLSLPSIFDSLIYIIQA